MRDPKAYNYCTFQSNWWDFHVIPLNTDTHIRNGKNAWHFVSYMSQGKEAYFTCQYLSRKNNGCGRKYVKLSKHENMRWTQRISLKSHIHHTWSHPIFVFHSYNPYSFKIRASEVLLIHLYGIWMRTMHTFRLTAWQVQVLVWTSTVCMTSKHSNDVQYLEPCRVAVK